jgi:hypothetical protein
MQAVLINVAVTGMITKKLSKSMNCSTSWTHKSEHQEKENTSVTINLVSFFIFVVSLTTLSVVQLIVSSHILCLWYYYCYSLINTCPSARCAYAANEVGKDLDIFAIGAVSLNHIYTHQPKIVNIISSQSWSSVVCNSCYLSSSFVCMFVCLLSPLMFFSSSSIL